MNDADLVNIVNEIFEEMEVDDINRRNGRRITERRSTVI